MSQSTVLHVAGPEFSVLQSAPELRPSQRSALSSSQPAGAGSGGDAGGAAPTHGQRRPPVQPLQALHSKAPAQRGRSPTTAARCGGWTPHWRCRRPRRWSTPPRRTGAGAAVAWRAAASPQTPEAMGRQTPGPVRNSSFQSVWRYCRQLGPCCLKWGGDGRMIHLHNACKLIPQTIYVCRRRSGRDRFWHPSCMHERYPSAMLTWKGRTTCACERVGRLRCGMWMSILCWTGLPEALH